MTQEREVPGLRGIPPDPGGPVPTCEHRTRELTRCAPGFGEVCSQVLGGRGRPSGGDPRWSPRPPGVCTQSWDCSRHVGQECRQPTGMLSAGKGPGVRDATEPCCSASSKIDTFRGTSSRGDFTVLPLKARPRPPSRCTGRTPGSRSAPAGRPRAPATVGPSQPARWEGLHGRLGGPRPPSSCGLGGGSPCLARPVKDVPEAI